MSNKKTKITLGPQGYEEKATECLNSLFKKESKYKFSYVSLSEVRKDAQPGLVINWGCEGVGFGQLAIISENESIKIDSENLDPEFVLNIFKYLIEDTISKGKYV